MAQIPPLPPAPQNDRIEDLQIERELQDSYLTYAMSTIMDRALPDVRDGLKPSQRRILVAMNDLGLGPRSKHRKCAKIAGDTSGNYHPHGEAVIYPALVRMAQNWNLRHTLVDGQGNFGSTDGDPPAAMRYTEARLTAPAMELLEDLNLDTVDFQANYDETREEPMVLPSKFPNLLVNGSIGIAVGMACNLLPHNLREICNAIILVIDNPDCTLAQLLELVPGPDFPSGGIIRGREGIVEGYKGGRGRMTLRAKIDVEEQKNGKSIVVISEMPYGVIRKSIMESVAECTKKDVLKEVSAINDHSGREYDCRIVLDLKRDADPQFVINQLFQYTPCQITVSMINIALVNRQPRTMGLKEMIQHFIDHRREVIVRRTRYLLRKAQQRGHILEGLIFAVCDIDEVVRLIRSSKTRDEAIERLRQRAFRIAPDHPAAPLIPVSLMERIAVRPVLLSQAQAEAIGRLQLIQLVGLEIEKLVKEYREVVDEISGYEQILGDAQRVLDIIRADTREMADKYGNDRRTQILGDASDLNLEDLISREDVVVTVSHGGYVKRIPLDTYRSQGRGGRGIKGIEAKEGDFVEHLFVANTHDYLMFFTNRGRVYLRKVYEVPEASRVSAGKSIANLLEFQEGEKIANVLAVRDFDRAEQFLIFATHRGVVKKTALSAYSNINRRGIIAIGLEEGAQEQGGDELIGVEITDGRDQILLGTRHGMAIRFNETDVRAMGRPAGGVRGIDLETGDEAVSMIEVPHAMSRGAGGGGAVPVDAAADAAPDGTEPPGGAGAQGESSSAESTPGESTPGETAGAAVAASPDAAPFEGVAAGGDDATIDMPAAELPAAGASGKCMVLTACVNGFGKRTPVDEYRLIRRGGKGVTNIKTSDRNGDVVALKAVCDDDELMLITEKGILIRTRVSEIRETGRNAQGVKLIRIDEGDRLVAMAKINTGVDTSKKPAGDGESPAAQEISAPPAAADAIGETDGGAAEGDARRDDAAEDGNELPSEQ